jgi:major membrane immunogen (membrane-anchored lipoprotein)
VYAAAQAILHGAKLDEKVLVSLTESLLEVQNNQQVQDVPGATIANPLSKPGAKKFCDASWKQSQEQSNLPSRLD